MRRTRIAHVVFPLPSLDRPLPGEATDAAHRLAESRGLDLEVIVPLPISPALKLDGLARSARGQTPWPDGIEGALAALDPRPTIVRYFPLPGRSPEAAAAAIGARLIARPRAGRPLLIQGANLRDGAYTATQLARALGCRSIAAAGAEDFACACVAARTRRALRDATAIIAACEHTAAQLTRFGRRAELIGADLGQIEALTWLVLGGPGGERGGRSRSELGQPGPPFGPPPLGLA